MFSNISNLKYFNCLITKDFKPLYTDYVFKKIDRIKASSILSEYDNFINETLKYKTLKKYPPLRLLTITPLIYLFNSSKWDRWTRGMDKYNEILLEKDYPKKRIELMNLRKEMSYFIYSIYGRGIEGLNPIGEFII